MNTLDAELVACRVDHHRPAPAVPLDPPDPGRPEGDQALDLRLLVLGGQVEVDAVLDRLGLGDSLEQEAGAGFVRIAEVEELAGRLPPFVAEDRGPELGQALDVEAVDCDGVDAGGRLARPRRRPATAAI